MTALLTYGISTYPSRYDRGQKLAVRRLPWDDIVELLTDFKRTSESMEYYHSLDGSTLEKVNIKDVGYFVGGTFDPPLRKACNLQDRSLLALDLDHIDTFDVPEIKEVFGKYTYLVHSSHTHTDESPRLRIVLPLKREIAPHEYEPLGRMVANMLGMDMFDDTTYQPSRVMFLPSCCADAEPYIDVNDGELLDPDVVLGPLDDVFDFGLWPQSTREKEAGGLRERKDKARLPWDIPGWVGAFCRVYTVEDVIEVFSLPYIESGEGNDRYTFTGGSGVDGAILYSDDGHLHSWHESDPASGNRNAWDLVRLHEYGHLDADMPKDTPISKAPSQLALIEYASQLPEVIRENAAQAPREVNAEDEFDDVAPQYETVEDSVTGETHKLKLEVTIDSLTTACVQAVQEGAEQPYIPRAAYDDLILRIAAAYSRGVIEDDDLEELSIILKDNHPSGQKVSKAAVMQRIKKKKKALKARGDEDEVKDIQLAFLQHFESQFYMNGEWIRRHRGQFWYYTGTHWDRASDEEISGKMVQSISDLRESTEDKKKLRALQAAVGEQQTSAIWSSLKNMYMALKTHSTMMESDTPKDPMGLQRAGLEPGINCLNGEIVFNDEGKYSLLPHNPESLYTSVIPAHYDKAATCPTWDEFCKVSFSKCSDPADMQRHLEEYCGYVLNRSRMLRCWSLFYGVSHSGKSTIGRVLSSLMGESSKSMDMSNYEGNNNHATAGLVGKQLLIDDDFQEGKLLNDGFVKTCSEEKQMSVNPKGKEEYDIVARVVLMICANNPPGTRDTSGALYNRALVFPFDHVVAEKDKDMWLSKKMLDESDGLLLRFTRGAARLFKRGGWDFPKDATAAWKGWTVESNQLPQFLESCTMVSKDGFLLASDLWRTYGDYSDQCGMKHRLTRTVFYRKVEQAWHDRVHTKIGDGWKGYSLIPNCLDERSTGERDSARDDFNDDGESWDT